MSRPEALNALKQALLDKKELYVAVRVRPNASETKITDILADNSLKLAIKAVPERGKANEEAAAFLAQTFGVARDKVKLISGAGERHKLYKLKM